MVRIGGRAFVPREVWDAVRPATPVSGSYDEWLRGQLDDTISSRASSAALSTHDSDVKTAVITTGAFSAPTKVVTSVSAGASVRITIQPPAGETWIVFVGGHILYKTANGHCGVYDGTDQEIFDHKDASEYGSVSCTTLANNAQYAYIFHRNPDTFARDSFIAYSYWKLG